MAMGSGHAFPECSQAEEGVAGIPVHSSSATADEHVRGFAARHGHPEREGAAAAVGDAGDLLGARGVQLGLNEEREVRDG